MRTALRSVDVSDAAILQRLTDFATADADLTGQSNQSQPRAAESAPIPVAEAGRADWFRLPMSDTSVIRIGITVFVLLAAAIIAAVARRGMRLSTQIDAVADALILSGGAVGEGFLDLARTLSPTGEIPRDLAQVVQPGAQWRLALRRRRGVGDVVGDMISGTLRLFRVRL
jgi:hypothetical protein